MSAFLFGVAVGIWLSVALYAGYALFAARRLSRQQEP